MNTIFTNAGNPAYFFGAIMAFKGLKESRFLYECQFGKTFYYPIELSW